jgi:hypothetical protein
MKKYVILALIFINHFINDLPAQPVIQWQKCLGGSNFDLGWRILHSGDGGYLVAGMTESTNGDVSGLRGARDFWMMKLNSGGTMEWQKCLGGTDWEDLGDAQKTTDGGYILAGHTKSNNGDVSGNHGSEDFWLVKTDSLGNLLWQKCFGGSGFDEAESVQQTSDGGFIVAGTVLSTDSQVLGNHGSSDVWVLKLDASGNLQWKNCFGGTGNDLGQSVLQTEDGGFLVSGITGSNNGQVSGNHGNYDLWLVKLNASGDLIWQKCIGGSGQDYPWEMKAINGGNFMLVGMTNSNNGDVSGNKGGFDLWMVKISGNGDLLFQNCFGGTGFDRGQSVQQTSDGGFLLTGSSDSNNGDLNSNLGGVDVWILKVSSGGSLEWQKSIGGTGFDRAFSILTTQDGSMVLAGNTESNDNQVSGNHGLYDAWVVKLNSGTANLPLLQHSTWQIEPNPSRGIFILKGDNAFLGKSFQIYNSQGKMVREGEINMADQPVSLEDQAAGMYSIRISGQSAMLKLLKW